MININNTPWEKLSSADILALLDNDNGESFFFEFKEDGVRNEQLQKEISAFANTYGGYIFLGITDKKDVTGCVKWTEERIHNVIYNNITPTPDFDIKQLEIKEKTIFVIKIEEGSMPPYITSDGKIFERVSSSSMPIKDSGKLTQLYAKYSENRKRIERKIGIEQLHLHDKSPNNLCGYIDLGFEVQCMDKSKIQNGFYEFDYAKISRYLKEKCGAFSISKVGQTKVITIGEMKANGEMSSLVLPEAAMNNFMVLMADGSAKFRICLFADDKGKVDLSLALVSKFVFRNIYEFIFKDNLNKNFIHAKKYAELVVLKQFTTFFSDSFADSLGMRLEDHIARYGNNLIVCGNRMPYNDYLTIDKRYMDSLGLEFTADEIITELFHDVYSVMGIIDRIKKQDQDDE